MDRRFATSGSYERQEIEYTDVEYLEEEYEHVLPHLQVRKREKPDYRALYEAEVRETTRLKMLIAIERKRLRRLKEVLRMQKKHLRWLRMQRKAQESRFVDRVLLLALKKAQYFGNYRF